MNWKQMLIDTLADAFLMVLDLALITMALGFVFLLAVGLLGP